MHLCGLFIGLKTAGVFIWRPNQGQMERMWMEMSYKHERTARERATLIYLNIQVLKRCCRLTAVCPSFIILSEMTPLHVIETSINLLSVSGHTPGEFCAFFVLRPD